MKRRIGSYFYLSSPRKSDITRKRWNLWNILGRAIKKTCMVLGAFMLFSILLSIVAAFVFGGKNTVNIPDEMILVLNVTDPIGETEHARSLADPFAAAGITIADLIETLDTASIDKRVKGLLVSFDQGGMELAHIQEVRQAVKRFRASGKFAHIYSASFADAGSGMGAYYFASAFDEIWMQPVGMLAITGLSLEMPFARALLDKVGATPEFLHREEYKSAMESFTNKTMSEPNRIMMTSILENLSSQIFHDIVTDRKIPTAIFESGLDRGLLTGADALKSGLITRLDYADILLDETRKKTGDAKNGDEMPLVALEDYFSVTSKPLIKDAQTVALVRIAGEIVPGADPEPGYATSDYIAHAIDDAAEDDAIKAIVVRVDSPGGSPTASETIRRSIVRAKEKGKKIIVSMGPLAASGGYWVTVDADRIFALPSTLTGSIGVIMGKFELSKLWEKIGVNWDGMTWGKNARLWSANSPLSESERAALEVAIDDTYKSFIDRVSKGRNMDPVKVRSLAKGRAWTGLQAKENGLVDDLGGLDVALDYTAKLIGSDNRSKLNIIQIPEPLTPLEQIMHIMGQQVFFKNWMGNSMINDFVSPFIKRLEMQERSGMMQTYEPDLRIR